MAHTQLNAPSPVSPEVPSPTPRSGVVHVNIRHSGRYTVVGNHLAQHRTLTLTAIGLAVHIQSLPPGARIGVKCLAARFPEGETRIASALRELEACGYLKRTRERLPSGQIVTRTVSHNHPGAAHPSPPGHVGNPASREHTASMRRSASAPVRPDATCTTTPRHVPTAVPAESIPGPTLPKPRTADPAKERTGAALLAALRHEDPRLLLSARDVDRLAPAVAAWLERGAGTEAVRSVLTANLPKPLRSPAALLGHRLTALIPPSLPPGTARPGTPSRPPHPLQTCDGCDRAFRAPEPGRCRDCRES